MAGTVVLSTLNDSSGVLATQNGMTGIAKAWARFGTSSATIAGSFNVSSITRNAAGDYTINFTTAMPNANYANVATCAYSAGVTISMATVNYSSQSNAYVAPTTSAYRVSVTSPSSTSGVDSDYISTAAFSS